MRRPSHSGNGHRKLPVFVSPEELRFFGEDEASHRQILTVYNPYEYNIRFKGALQYSYVDFSIVVYSPHHLTVSSITCAVCMNVIHIPAVV